MKDKSRPTKLSTNPIGVFLVMAFSAASPTHVLSQAQPTTDFEDRVIEAIINNPEVILVAMQKLKDLENKEQQAQSKARVSKHADQLFGTNDSIKVVEFFDYRCGYCSRAAPDVQLVSDENPGSVKLIEFPILGPDSEDLSKFSLSVKAIYGDQIYKAFHYAMIEPASAQRGIVAARRIAQVLKLDIERISEKSHTVEIMDEIQKNRALARSVGVTGTPAFITKGGILEGMQSYETLQNIIKQNEG